MDELSLLLNTHPLEVVAITKSWLANEIIDELILIDGYNTFRKDIVHDRGGGVCAFVSADIPCKRRQDRGKHVLDLIVTNLDEIYNEPTVTAPLGTSDHNVVKWTPSASGLHGKNTSKKHVLRFPQSARDAFGRWCNSHTWFADVKNHGACSELASSFTQDLSLAIDRIFPTKIVKIHCTDKPWMTPSLKQLIHKRQRAFHSGDRDLWRHHRSKVKKEISLKKHSFYTNKVQHLKSCNPKKWWERT